MSGEHFAFFEWVRRRYPKNSRWSSRASRDYREWFYRGAWDQWRALHPIDTSER